MSDTIRAFIALKLPENILSFIKKIQKDLKQYGFALRWVKPENIHLTLKFFGNVSDSEAENIKLALSDCIGRFSPLLLSANAIGVFPSIMRPKVIWVGISGQMPMLFSLQNVLEKRLEEVGFKKEDRPFQGHLTMGRFKGRVDSAKLVEAIKKYKDINSDVFAAEEIILYKSDLKPDGPVYTELFNAPLIKNMEA